MRGRGSTPPTRGGATTAAKAPAGGTRGRTSPTKPAGAPGRGASRGGTTAAASRTSGILYGGTGGEPGGKREGEKWDTIGKAQRDGGHLDQELNVREVGNSPPPPPLCPLPLPCMLGCAIFSQYCCPSSKSRHQNVHTLVFYCFLVTASKPSTSTPSAHKSGACSPTKQPTTTKQSTQAKPPATSAPVKPAEPSPATEPKPSGPLNKPSYHASLGLARVLMRKGGDSINEAHKLYEEVISMAPAVHDAYIELADSLIKADPMKAVDTYSKYPFQEPLTFDDAYIHGEMVRLLMKNEKYDDARLGPSMVSLGKVMGLTVLEKYVDTLDKIFKYSKLLMQVYAGVHGKSVDDPDLQQFFKFKCWV